MRAKSIMISYLRLPPFIKYDKKEDPLGAYMVVTFLCLSRSFCWWPSFRFPLRYFDVEWCQMFTYSMNIAFR